MWKSYRAEELRSVFVLLVYLFDTFIAWQSAHDGAEGEEQTQASFVFKCIILGSIMFKAVMKIIEIMSNLKLKSNTLCIRHIGWARLDQNREILKFTFLTFIPVLPLLFWFFFIVWIKTFFEKKFLRVKWTSWNFLKISTECFKLHHSYAVGRSNKCLLKPLFAVKLKSRCWTFLSSLKVFGTSCCNKTLADFRETRWVYFSSSALQDATMFDILFKRRILFLAHCGVYQSLEILFYLSPVCKFHKVKNS